VHQRMKGKRRRRRRWWTVGVARDAQWLVAGEQ
jgi:hypothetical protein